MVQALSRSFPHASDRKLAPIPRCLQLLSESVVHRHCILLRGRLPKSEPLELQHSKVSYWHRYFPHGPPI